MCKLQSWKLIGFYRKAPSRDDPPKEKLQAAGNGQRPPGRDKSHQDQEKSAPDDFWWLIKHWKSCPLGNYWGQLGLTAQAHVLTFSLCWGGSLGQSNHARPLWHCLHILQLSCLFIGHPHYSNHNVTSRDYFSMANYFSITPAASIPIPVCTQPNESTHTSHLNSF